MYLSLTDLKVPFHLPPQEKMRVRFTTLKGRQMLNIAEREEITNKGQMEQVGRYISTSALMFAL